MSLAGKSLNKSLEFSRDEIVALMEEIAQGRRGATASDLLRAFHDGTLHEPGELIDFLSLADLLRDNDPLKDNGSVHRD